VHKGADLLALCPSVARIFEADQAVSFEEALRSLYVLFVNCARVQEYVNPDWLVEFAGTIPPPNPYRTNDEAMKALHDHPVYLWLKGRMGKILGRMPTAPMKEFGAVFELLDHLVVASIEAERAKVTDAAGGPKLHKTKQRNSAKKRAEGLISDLDNGTIALNQEMRALLRSLLEKTVRLLAANRSKAVTYPILQSLARTFVLNAIEDPDASLLLEAAEFMEIGCDRTTASRYTERASKVWSGRSVEALLEFRILYVLRDDHRQRAALAH
jgi:hypothetical protein